MKFKVSDVYSLVLVLVAFSSLVSMFALSRADSIVREELLRFSYEWAMPYWTMTSLVFVMGWVNIIMACAFQFYVLLYGRKKEGVIPQKEALKPEITQPPIEEKPIEAEEEKVEEPKPEEMKPAETVVAETKETIAPPMEVELGTRKEEEEAQKPTVPQQLIVCQICGAQNSIGTKFCRYCGSLLKPEEIPPAIEEASPEERHKNKTARGKV